MKNILTCIAFILLSVSCKKKEAEQPTPSFKSDVAVLNFSKEAGEETISITSDGDWQVSVQNADWLQLNKTSGSGNDELKFTVKQSDKMEIRSADLVFTAKNGTKLATLRIDQGYKSLTKNAEILIANTGSSNRIGAIVSDANNNVLAAGAITNSMLGFQTAYLVKSDIQGKQLWAKEFAGTGAAAFNDIIVLPDGIVAAGTIQNKAWIIKLSSDGQQVIWEKKLSGYNYTTFNSIAKTDKGFICAGTVYDPALSSENIGLLMAFDDAGNSSPEKLLKVANSNIVINSLKKDASGFVALVKGYPTDTELSLVKFDEQYNIIWKVTESSPGDIRSFTAAQVKDGYLFGVTKATIEVITKCDVNGKMLWTKTFKTSGNTNGIGSILETAGGYYIGSNVFSADGIRRSYIYKINEVGKPILQLINEGTTNTLNKLWSVNEVLFIGGFSTNAAQFWLASFKL